MSSRMIYFFMSIIQQSFLIPYFNIFHETIIGDQEIIHISLMIVSWNISWWTLIINIFHHEQSSMSIIIWLVVWNIFSFPCHIWDNPSHWLSYFSRWLKPPTSHEIIPSLQAIPAVSWPATSRCSSSAPGHVRRLSRPRAQGAAQGAQGAQGAGENDGFFPWIFHGDF